MGRSNCAETESVDLQELGLKSIPKWPPWAQAFQVRVVRTFISSVDNEDSGCGIPQREKLLVMGAFPHRLQMWCEMRAVG